MKVRRMRGLPCRPLLALLVAASTSALALEVPAHDVAGSHDHPVVSRFAGSVIVGYAQKDFDTATLPLARYDAHKPSHYADSEQPEGTVTRIAYVAPAGKTTLEVYRNFEQALRAAGFHELFACGGSDDCGGFDFSTATLEPLLDGLHGERNLMVSTIESTNGDVRALTARLVRPAGNVDLSLLVSQNSHAPVGVLLQIVEAKAMAAGQVTVDAKAMRRGLAQDGHIALYGIHFASDSATLTKDSSATLAEMAKLLKTQPALKVYIVGHTDDSGSLAHNLALSQQRAEAVAKALATDYGIAPARLAAKGVASYAPVASNRDDAGKARNRRVELVEQ
jgi:outer membrane protein OmpA-like peptidoglycan-associated protein